MFCKWRRMRQVGPLLWGKLIEHGLRLTMAQLASSKKNEEKDQNTFF